MPTIVGFRSARVRHGVGEVCARAATVDEDGDARWRPAVKTGDGAAGGFPSLAAPLSDRVRDCRWGTVAQANLMT